MICAHFILPCHPVDGNSYDFGLIEASRLNQFFDLRLCEGACAKIDLSLHSL